jgi:hypothetical protein
MNTSCNTEIFIPNKGSSEIEMIIGSKMLYTHNTLAVYNNQKNKRYFYNYINENIFFKVGGIKRCQNPLKNRAQYALFTKL